MFVRQCSARLAGLDNVGTHKIDGECLDELDAGPFDAVISRVSIIRRRAQMPPPLTGQPGPFCLGKAEVLENAIDLARDDLAKARTAAVEADVTVVIGINEHDGTVGCTTLYNSAVVIGPDGEIINHHRSTSCSSHEDDRRP